MGALLTRAWTWLVPEGSTRLAPRSYMALALLALALHLPGQIGVPAIDRDEARFAQATKQMLQSGDFIDIRLGEDPRYLQPVGIYWLQSITAAPFGAEDAPITAFRLPSLLAMLAGVLLTAWLGTRIAGPAVGFGGGLLFAMSLLVSVESHFAKTDSVLMLSVLTAQTALYHVISRLRDGPVSFVGWPLVFWFALAFGVLIKGPIPLLVVGLTIAAYALWTRSLSFIAALGPLRGLPITVSLIAPWLIAIYIATDGYFYEVAIGHSFGGKIAGAHDKHSGPFGYHMALFAITFFPGVIAVGLGAVRAFRERADWRVQFLVCWIVPTYIMFESVGTKLPHYPLPTFPAIAILAAWGISTSQSLLQGRIGRIAHGVSAALFVVAGLVVAAVAGAGQSEFYDQVFLSAYVAAGFGLIVLIAGAWFIWKPRLESLLPIWATLFILYGTVFQFIIPSMDRMWVSDRAADEIAALTGCDDLRVGTAGYREPSNLFQFGKDTFLATSGEQAAEFLGSESLCTLMMVDESVEAAFLQSAQESGLALKTIGSIDGRNYVDGADLNITYYTSAASPLTK